MVEHETETGGKLLERFTIGLRAEAFQVNYERLTDKKHPLTKSAKFIN